MQRFPPELEDTIIDLLHTDPPTLASCGLVCRSWLPSSRYHLYSDILLTAQNASAFTAILASTPHIALLVRKVQIRFSDATLRELVPILSELPRTTSLAFRPTKDEVARNLTPALLQPVLLDATRIEHLTFDFKSRFDSLRQVIDCVCLCPQLVSLELGGSWLRMGDFDNADLGGGGGGIQLPRALRALTLTCDLDYILRWFLQLENGAIPDIETLVLHHIVRREVPAIAAYLQRAGPTLRSLSLLFRDNDAPGRLANQVDFMHNPNLLQLALEGTTPHILACLLNLLPQLKLERLTLTLRHASYYPDAMQILEEFPWTVLDGALVDSPHLKRLEVVVLDPLTRQVLPALAAFVRERLPCVAAAGILGNISAGVD
ncbi:hypothetical protein C8F01DRAFT_1251944 [Mycena amicta]|nr:hypothetical protein C8F01DRAFT_1251944 [Mycena amicta]